MKTKPINSGLLAFGLAILAFVPVQADDSNTKLNQAVGLMNNNQPKEARGVLATIPANDMAHAKARGYDALCLSQLDKRKFLDALESGEIQAADIPSDLREDLDYKQIDALLFYRKFEQLLPKTAEFFQRHGNSPRMEAVREYQMAALYERGMKNLGDAAFTMNGKTSKDVEGTAKRLRVAQDNLAQFLKLAADGEQDSYQTLTDRDLATEVVTALSALGGENEAIQLVPLGERENMAMALVKLHQKTDTDADAKLRRMTSFLNQFPNSKHGKRVQYDMGEVAFKEGLRLAWENQRTNAAPYLDKAREVLSGVVADGPAGISQDDALEARMKLLLVYYAQKDWTSLSNQASQMLTNTPAGKRDWLATKLYIASGLAGQRKLSEATSAFDEILAIGFKGTPTIDGLMVSAAAWRVNLALETGDKETARQVAQAVQNSNCYDSLKRTFVKQFKTLLTEPNPVSK